jgi:hypothetical protein
LDLNPSEEVGFNALFDHLILLKGKRVVEKMRPTCTSQNWLRGKWPGSGENVIPLRQECRLNYVQPQGSKVNRRFQFFRKDKELTASSSALAMSPE